MELQVLEEDLFAASADAVFIAIDGAAHGMEGRLARSFSVRFPDAGFLEELDSQLDYPVPLGSANPVELEDDTSPFRLVIVLSTLDHREALSHSARRSVAASALLSSLRIAASHECKTVRTPVLTGGWRLSQEDAFNAMLSALDDSSHRSSVEKIQVCCLENGGHLSALASSRGW